MRGCVLQVSDHRNQDGMYRRITCGRVEVTVTGGFARVETGAITASDIDDLRAALAEAQQILRRQQ